MIIKTDGLLTAMTAENQLKQGANVVLDGGTVESVASKTLTVGKQFDYWLPIFVMFL